ncbi:MAG: hypothetical protein LBK27_03660 [Treponema sp.]|jgi:hypothetical protein|nr:hypothetical protein [Treponema sp.]
MTTALIALQDAKNNGALVYVNEGHLNPSAPLYKTEVTVIKLDVKNDCHNISGKLMPKREVVDRVGEASAISYVSSGCRTWTEARDDSAGKRTVFISEQQGTMRLPDGSYRTGSVQAYEFDPNLRAMVDIGVDEWNEQTKQARKNGSGKTVAALAMDYSKFGRQRAETGARLRVIKELTGMPTVFSPEEAGKPMVFSRVVMNTDYLLKTPEGRLLAAAQATGTQDVIAALYGKQALPDMGRETAPEPRDVTEQSGVQGNTGAGLAGEAAGDGDDWADLKPAAEQDTLEALTLKLEEYLNGYRDQLDVALEGKNGKVNPYDLAVREFQDPKATAESRKAMLSRIERLIKSTEGKAS